MSVFELPMRDGNTAHQDIADVAVYVFELPMRDGNACPQVFPHGRQDSFWTSYEGWKPGWSRTPARTGRGFWTSYEGWKLIIGDPVNIPWVTGFWTSYEGWKPDCGLIFDQPQICFWTSYEGWKPVRPSNCTRHDQVFELPMRDGNRT